MFGPRTNLEVASGYSQRLTKVMCVGCGVQFIGESLVVCLQKWNKRTPPPKSTK